MEKIDWSKRVMDIFLEICKIPRPSGREDARRMPPWTTIS